METKSILNSLILGWFFALWLGARLVDVNVPITSVPVERLRDSINAAGSRCPYSLTLEHSWRRGPREHIAIEGGRGTIFLFREKIATVFRHSRDASSVIKWFLQQIRVDHLLMEVFLCDYVWVTVFGVAVGWSIARLLVFDPFIILRSAPAGYVEEMKSNESLYLVNMLRKFLVEKFLVLAYVIVKNPDMEQFVVSRPTESVFEFASRTTVTSVFAIWFILVWSVTSVTVLANQRFEMIIGFDGWVKKHDNESEDTAPLSTPVETDGEDTILENVRTAVLSTSDEAHEEETEAESVDTAMSVITDEVHGDETAIESDITALSSVSDETQGEETVLDSVNTAISAKAHEAHRDGSISESANTARSSSSGETLAEGTGSEHSPEDPNDSNTMMIRLLVVLTACFFTATAMTSFGFTSFKAIHGLYAMMITTEGLILLIRSLYLTYRVAWWQAVKEKPMRDSEAFRLRLYRAKRFTDVLVHCLSAYQYGLYLVMGAVINGKLIALVFVVGFTHHLDKVASNLRDHFKGRETSVFLE